MENNSELDFIFLEDDFWEKMEIYPVGMSGINDPEYNIKQLTRYSKNDLDFILIKTINIEVEGNKEDIAYFILNNKNLVKVVRILFVIREVAKSFRGHILDSIIENMELNPPKSNPSKIIVILFHSPFELMKARILSINDRRNRSISYHLSNLENNFLLEKYFKELENRIEDKISEPGKRAKLHEPIYNEETIVISVKYEKGIRRSEEFDSSHFDNPIDWVILNLDIKNNVISIKGSESKMARNVISETVSTISPNDELVEVSKDIDIFHPKENIKLFVESSLSTPSIKNDEIKNIELKLQLITYSDTNLEGNPLISLSGEDVRPALADIIKNTSILEDSDIFEYRCNFKYEIEGLSKSAIFLKEKGIIKPTKFEKMISSSEEIQIENIMRSLFGIAK